MMKVLWRASIRRLALVLLVGALICVGALPDAQAMTRSQAINIVRNILRKNAASCRLKVRSVSAVSTRFGWRVTAKVQLLGRGQVENAVWNVGDRAEVAPADQMTAEIAHGCP